MGFFFPISDNAIKKKEKKSRPVKFAAKLVYTKDWILSYKKCSPGRAGTSVIIALCVCQREAFDTSHYKNLNTNLKSPRVGKFNW